MGGNVQSNLVPKEAYPITMLIVLKMLYIVITIHVLGIFCTNLGFTMHELPSHENFPLTRIFFFNCTPLTFNQLCYRNLNMSAGPSKYQAWIFFRCFIFSIISVIFFHFWDERLAVMMVVVFLCTINPFNLQSLLKSCWCGRFC